jgi:hypothetical protein
MNLETFIAELILASAWQIPETDAWFLFQRIDGSDDIAILAKWCQTNRVLS